MGKHKRSRSRSRSRSPGRDRSRKEEKRERRKERKKREKERTKAEESAEAKYARRLAKKDAKEKKRLEAMGLTKEYLGIDTPFGDANILQPFVWHKKREKEAYLNLNTREHEQRDKSRMLENRRELEKVKKRREERERERGSRQQELELLQRMKEAEQFKEWEQQEDEFHLQQAKLRSKVRLVDGRAKPIDCLAKYIDAEDDDLTDVEMKEPYFVLKGLSIEDLEDLVEDIKVYIGLDQTRNLEFWKDMTVICENELHKLRKAVASLSVGDGFDRRGGIHKAVGKDVYELFDGKTHDELLELKSQIMKRIRSGDAVDIGYWETLLQELKAHLAKARLKENHQELLRKKLDHLRNQTALEATKSDHSSDSEESDSESDSKRRRPLTEGSSKEAPDAVKREEKEEEEEISVEDLLSQCCVAYEEGNYSPKPMKYEEIDESVTLLVSPDEDQYQLEISRQRFLSQQANIPFEMDSDRRCLLEAQRGEVEEGETAFNVQVELDQKTYLWQDKYRPRKPRFFNRVHTGYEWNKYNQTHYDGDNPPPKIVQGYKFNIFYPDLIDKKETPRFFLDQYSGSRDFLILRFHAGPPYEDIAFKVVNRDWDYSHQHGFRCQYSQGIFQLWFRYKRYRYRR